MKQALIDLAPQGADGVQGTDRCTPRVKGREAVVAVARDAAVPQRRPRALARGEDAALAAPPHVAAHGGARGA